MKTIVSVTLCAIMSSVLGCRPELVIGRAEEAVAAETTHAASSSSSGDDETSASTGFEVCDAPGPVPPCDAAIHPAPPAEQVVTNAMGLGCPGMPVHEVAFVWSDYTSWKTPRTYGNGTWAATEGDALLLLTTGIVPEPDAAGRVVVSPGATERGANGNPSGVGLPEPIQPTRGSNAGNGGAPGVDCHPTGDCSDTLAEAWSGGPANDLVYLRFSLDVPAGTHGWEVDLAWLSAEFPQRPHSDLLVWWQSSEAFTGNVATLQGRPANVAGLLPHLVDEGLWGDAPELLGTGYEGTTAEPCTLDAEEVLACPRGAASGWFTLSGPVEPGERVTMVLALFDMIDSLVDTTVLVDRFRWSCAGCVVGDDCGLVR